MNEGVKQTVPYCRTAVLSLNSCVRELMLEPEFAGALLPEPVVRIGPQAGMKLQKPEPFFAQRTVVDLLPQVRRGI